MNIEQFSPGWSPTQARLNRRRNKSEKLQLDLSAHIDGVPSLDDAKNNNNNRDKDALNDSFSKNLDAAVQALTPEQKKLLDILQDPSKPLRERVEAEVKLQKDPDAAQIMKDVKYTGGRKTTILTKERTVEQEQAAMNALLKEEKARDKAEKKEFQKKRQQLQKEERDRKAREYKALVDARKQAADVYAKDSMALKEMATKTKKKVQENAEKKSRRQKQQEEQEKELERELMATEENDVLRKLKEAKIRQKGIETQ